MAVYIIDFRFECNKNFDVDYLIVYDLYDMIRNNVIFGCVLCIILCLDVFVFVQCYQYQGIY